MLPPLLILQENKTEARRSKKQAAYSQSAISAADGSDFIWNYMFVWLNSLCCGHQTYSLNAHNSLIENITFRTNMFRCTQNSRIEIAYLNDWFVRWWLVVLNNTWPKVSLADGPNNGLSRCEIRFSVSTQCVHSLSQFSRRNPFNGQTKLHFIHLFA